MTSWWRDLGFGMRLAVGGGRTSWSRLVLGTIGIGMATAVLLVAASVHHIVTSHADRTTATTPVHAPRAGVAPLRYTSMSSDFFGRRVDAEFVRATGPNSPVPPGLDRLPRAGEVVVSPALARLLAAPDGALLRPQVPGRVIGEIGQQGLGGPRELRFVAGFAADQVTPWIPLEQVYAFGLSDDHPMDVTVLALMIVGTVALLVPILIMISVSSRIAGAARDRRLAALRLVGAGSGQVRRIAAAESLVPAVTGLLLGGALFLGFRQVVPNIEILGVSVFTSDVVPPVALVVLVAALVPVLTVGSALFAMRRMVIEPLGVVRGGRPVRRRLWWRIALTAVGVAVLLRAASDSTHGPQWTVMVVTGASALLVGVPALLPYLLERVVGALRGGPPAWQLAVRRLQLDSGTAARVVSGVAVVLAGAIALQSVFTATASRIALPAAQAPTGFAYVATDRAVQDQVDAAIQRTGAAREWYPMTVVGEVGVHDPAVDATTDTIGIASCAAIERLTGVTGCHDGDVFADPDGRYPIQQGIPVRITGDPVGELAAAPAYGRWQVPAHVRLTPPGQRDWPGMLQWLVTPGAIAGVALPPDPDTWTLVWTDPADPQAVQRLNGAAAVQPLRATVVPADVLAEPDADQ
ncbi:MAG TPA: FtsX-like permease family protein, partial [Pseudonocardiaceae bacterium]|nr:FtsX-like permease family protein [Pseudonocardiaceae bacterium]